MEERGISDGFYQELSSAKEEYTPDFDLTGIICTPCIINSTLIDNELTICYDILTKRE